MAAVPTTNAQILPLPHMQTSPPRPWLGRPETPQAPKRERYREGREDSDHSPTHGPRRRLFQAPPRDHAAQLERTPDDLTGSYALIGSPSAHKPIEFTLVPRRLFVNEAEGDSRVALQNTNQGDDFDVDKLSASMRGSLISSAGSANESEALGRNDEE